MDDDYPVALEPATPESVLALLRDRHRHYCEFDPCADRHVRLTFDSTISDLGDAFDLRDPDEVGTVLNNLWGINVPPEEWEVVLKPVRKRTVREVCELIAPLASSPVIRPARILGRECHEAGAFLTVRSALLNHGVPVLFVHPSTPLAPFLSYFPEEFVMAASSLSPGSLPTIRVENPVDYWTLWGLLFSLIMMPFLLALNSWLKLDYLGMVGILLLTVAIVMNRLAPFIEHHPKATFGDLKTFGDLARCLVAGKNSGKLWHAKRDELDSGDTSS